MWTCLGKTKYVTSPNTFRHAQQGLWCPVSYSSYTLLAVLKKGGIELAHKPSQSSLRQKGKASIPYWEPTDNRSQHTKLRSNGELAPCGLVVCAPRIRLAARRLVTLTSSSSFFSVSTEECLNGTSNPRSLPSSFRRITLSTDHYHTACRKRQFTRPGCCCRRSVQRLLRYSVWAEVLRAPISKP
jgi:hypothetical protein